MELAPKPFMHGFITPASEPVSIPVDPSRIVALDRFVASHGTVASETATAARQYCQEEEVAAHVPSHCRQGVVPSSKSEFIAFMIRDHERQVIDRAKVASERFFFSHFP